MVKIGSNFNENPFLTMSESAARPAQLEFEVGDLTFWFKKVLFCKHEQMQNISRKFNQTSWQPLQNDLRLILYSYPRLQTRYLVEKVVLKIMQDFVNPPYDGGLPLMEQYFARSSRDFRDPSNYLELKTHRVIMHRRAANFKTH